MIIWLASYPRSGNTYLRLLLHHFYGVNTYSLYEGGQELAGQAEIFELIGYTARPDTIENMANAEEVYFVKTHELPHDIFPAIYLIRDGRDVLLSYGKYIQTYGDTKSGLKPQDFSQETLLRSLITNDGFFGGWNQHVVQWSRRQAPTAFIRFEDLIHSPEPLEIVQQVLKHLNTPLSEVAHSATLPGFKELHHIMPQFFRQGQSGNWQRELSPELHNLFWEKHGDAMCEIVRLPFICNGSSSSLAQDPLGQPHHTLLLELHALAKQRLQLLHQQEKELAAKEEVIQAQHREQKAKDVLIESQQRGLIDKEALILQQQQELEKRGQIIQAQQHEFTTKKQELEEKEQVIHAQRQELIEKEHVIQSLVIFRYSSLQYWLFYVPIVCVKKLYQTLHPKLRQLSHYPPMLLNIKRMLLEHLQEKIHQMRRTFQPKLGQLSQYPPIPLNVPKQYYHVLLPAQESLLVVSIVTPSFNQAQFLERTIKSVFQQHYPKLEYIIQDGASTDGTPNILEQYQEQLAFSESCRDTGQANAINRGLQHATGKIMAWLNSDDMLLPGTLAYVVNYFLTHPEVDVVYGHRILVNEQDEEIGRWILPPHDNAILRWADWIPQETLFWRRSLWDKVGAALDESFDFALDWDLLLRFEDAGATFARLPRFLSAFRVHAAQKTSQALEDRGYQEMYRLRERYHGRYVSHQEASRHSRRYMVKHLLWHVLYRCKNSRF